LTIQWSKSCPCTDEALALLGLSQGEVPEREQSREYRPDLRITDKRTSSTFGDSLDDEGEGRIVGWWDSRIVG